MPVPLLDLSLQYTALQSELDEAVAQVVRSQRFIMGPAVERLEQQLAEWIGVPYAIGCASGTDAILLSLKALDLEPGAEVIVPSFTFFATAGATWNAGLRPVFCDVDPETFNVTAETIEAALTPQTRAIVVVHLYGQMADMQPIVALARERNLAIIEDAAQSIGAKQQIDGEWKQAGTLGIAGTFSFFPSKNLGGFGDGGLITTTDDALAERLRKLRVHGGRQMYHHELVGTNSRLDTLQAAVLSAKLPYLEGWAEARQRNAADYDRRLAALEPQLRRPVVLEKNGHVYNQYTIRCERRDELKAFLDARQIGNAIYYPVPLHRQECFAELGYREGTLPVTEQLTREVLSIPVFPELTMEQRAEVSAAIEEFYTMPRGGR